ncbi:terminase gpP N-terminus-related DNA-binding protein [Flagellimonas eckloniae]|uniref:Terminase ATPase subunit N-terminal domain-containing protein n=1 Tax=Flagellimonas eckloniae TaxID=346185 RepID=A0A0Q1BI12_9FLAO|nr:hypothetical protein [Allomuricauda eckloniae]KQC30184.1 hypothetical protein AAY42_10075 [Allomuricauda eckloniae]
MGKSKAQAVAKELFLKGKNQKEIAQLTDTTEKTIGVWVRKFGWKQEREARFIGRRTQEENLRKLISDLAAKAIRIESEMEMARTRGETNKFLELQNELNRVTDAASKWNKQLEAIAKENNISLVTYIQVMDQIFESVRQYSPKLYMDMLDFQEEHLTEVSLKLG